MCCLIGLLSKKRSTPLGKKSTKNSYEYKNSNVGYSYHPSPKRVILHSTTFATRGRLCRASVLWSGGDSNSANVAMVMSALSV